jgi:peptidoglycan/LPS O-acetylase OafA/YrhL
MSDHFKPASERIPSLDGLRAISIGLVVFSHLIGNLGIPVFEYGNLGVRIFFIISGFLITSILLAELVSTSTLNLKKFYFRRTLRIFPAYYFFLLVTFVLSLNGIFQIPASQFLIPVFYLSNYLAPLSWELGHTWSLAVEEQFYLLFPGVMLLLGINRLREVLIYVILLIPVIRLLNLMILQTHSEHIPFSFTFAFHNNMDALACGCLLAIGRDALRKNEIYNSFLTTRPGIAALLVLIVAVVFYSTEYLIIYAFVGTTVLNFSIVFCIDWLISNPESRLGRVLNSKPFVFVGVISYSIYLWQQPFLKFAEGQWWTHFPINVILLTTCAILSYFLVEKTFLNLRKRGEKKFAGTPSEHLRKTSALESV